MKIKDRNLLLASAGILKAVQSNVQFLETAFIEEKPIPPLRSSLRALTVRQPWATAIRDLGKRLENRTWEPPDLALGQVIAIHAGRSFEEDGADWIAARCGVMLTSKAVPLGAIIALARLQQVVTESDDMWFEGPYGWVLADILPLEPVMCRGKLGLWPVPVDVHRGIQAQLDKKMSENFTLM